jgi:large subunit ribosomal protein L25
MKLTITPRGENKKGAINEIRRKGDIPAILYVKGKICEPIVINGVEFKAILRNLKPGHLPTTIFTLSDKKHERRVIIKDIQRHTVNYQVSHIDFEELVDNETLSLKVPVTMVGTADCIGVKLGGFLRQVIRYVKVECMPNLIPTEFLIDVKELGIKQTKRLSDIVMPKGVKPLASLDEVIVVVAKGKG